MAGQANAHSLHQHEWNRFLHFFKHTVEMCWGVFHAVQLWFFRYNFIAFYNSIARLVLFYIFYFLVVVEIVVLGIAPSLLHLHITFITFH